MRINLNPKQFEHLVAQYLLDMMLNPENIKNEKFENIITKMEKTGLKSILLNYYLSMKSQERLNYKRIKKPIYDPETNQDSIIKISNRVNINESEETLNDDKYKIIYIIKEVLRLVKKIKYRKNRNISETELNKIIKKVIDNNED